MSQLKALCGWTPPQGEEETKQVQQQVLSSKNTHFSHSSGCSCASRTIWALSLINKQLMAIPKPVYHLEPTPKGCFSFGTVDLDQLVPRRNQFH